MEVKDVIKNRRKELELTMKQVADAIGVSEGTVSRWESGEIANMRRDKIVALANILHLSPAVIMGWDESTSNNPAISVSQSSPHLVTIPVYASVSAGPGCFADGNIESYIEIPEEMARHGEFFALRVRGDSMEPDIKDGDIVIAKKSNVASEGNIVIAIVNGDEGFCKRLSMYAEGLCLVSNNPYYAPKVFTKAEVRDLPVKIVGVVQRLVRDYFA